jgi:CheY-like chemotaxis protein
MKRFEQPNSPLVFFGVPTASAIVYLADLYAPLGVAVFIFYLIPVFLTLFSGRPALPLWVALLTTALIAVDGWLTPVGEISRMAHLNRGFATVTIWLVAGIGYQFIRNRQFVRKQVWLQTGQNGLAEKLEGDQRLAELGDNALGFLCEYLGAQAGAFFVADASGFQREAAHAAAFESLPSHFVIGEGLLGQSAKDGDMRSLANVPEDYLTVSSSFGKSKPRHLLIVPIKCEGEVNAVIEFGFFQSIQQSDMELLARVTPSLGVAVRSANYRMQLQKLLRETQQQSEEVQAQSEELRVSNEELEEQGRALRESQIRLERQQVELEQTNVQLEEQAQMLEGEKNKLSQAKSALERQARLVEQASRYKSDFLANMSHELRTPLNSSLILAKLLSENRSGNLTPEQVKYAVTIESAGNDLLTLINDVLDLSKIEAGHMEIHAEPIRLTQLVENLRATFEPVAAQKNLSLSLDVHPDVPATFTTDAQRLSQILKNLLSNALKFTATGGVSLNLRPVADGRLALIVQDSGIGISTDQQRTIFEPFYQADGTTSRKYGGTGLGLSISRELVRLLGGEILLQSELGQGSTFTIHLPQLAIHPTPEDGPQSQTPPSTRPDQPPLTAPVYQQVPDDRESLNKGRRVILTVEDDKAFAQIVAELAHEMHFQCLIACTADEALALAQQHLPSAIVLDVGLPDNSGLVVLERLKRDSRTRHIPVHMVSASDYTQTALALGAVGYMLKPVKREQLVEAFQQLESRLTQRMRRILVVEDDPVQVEAMRDLLESREVDTVTARSAAECLEQLKQGTFDCMVLDLSLPDASGFSLLETLSTEEAYSFPPVIVYTGHELSAEEEVRLRRYSRSIIIKGAKSPERLLDEVTLFLHQVVADLPPEKQRMLELASNRDAVLEGRCILIVEDDVRNIFALTSLLEGRGVELQIARNGREALEVLDQSQLEGSTQVDLVLMDIMMPEMDGITAMREIRNRPEWKKLPIIALTAKAMKDDQEECLQAGANDYLAKPLDVEKLLSLIRVWMPR